MRIFIIGIPLPPYFTLLFLLRFVQFTRLLQLLRLTFTVTTAVTLDVHGYYSCYVSHH